MKTYAQKLNEILSKGDDGNKWEKLVFYAYYAGREQATEEICDKADEVRNAQLQRAWKCRYHKMAQQIITGEDPKTPLAKYAIYSPDYAGDYQATFCSEIFQE